MLKKLLAAVAVMLALSGCIAVPVYDTGPGYGAYYGPPAASFSFGYTYHDHGYRPRYHRHGYRR